MFKTKEKKVISIQWVLVGLTAFVATMCVPPDTAVESDDSIAQARLDSLREVRCPRLMSSAAEYYRNRDWESTVRIYRELTELGCDEYGPSQAVEIYQYYAIAYEYLGNFDSSEVVLLKGLQKIPGNVDLRKRLAYAYKKQGFVDKQIIEYERLMEIEPGDVAIMMDLSKLYKDEDRCDDQIYVLKKLLDVEPSNEIAQGELAIAYEKCGKDPLEVYKERFDNNPDNVSYGLDYADRLIKADRPEDAVKVLERVLTNDNSSKLAYRKLGQAHVNADNLEEASEAYKNLFKLDPRDFRVAIRISEVFIDIQNYGEAYRWADKAISVSNSAGEAYGQKGNVYYKAFQNCRSESMTNDDRVVASLAYTNLKIAEEKGFRRFSSSKSWLEENEKDVLFTRATWFMLDDNIKQKGFVRPQSACYDWVDETISKDPSW